MHNNIIRGVFVKFVDRNQEMQRLMRSASTDGNGLVVIWGRRRLGKSRLLTEWCKHTQGIYWVADESAPAIQRRYLAEELSAIFPGFADVPYPDWSALFDRLSRESKHINWRGPLVLDEFPYLVAVAPELPSVLQRWIDREKRDNGILLALSGSSQRMMLDSVLKGEAPLYGRADQILKLEPLLPGHIGEAIKGLSSALPLLDFYTCWGGVPRYWELAQPFHGQHKEAVDDLILSPMGVLHDEVERLLRQEMPSAIPLRPILDAIGMGAHKSSEIAARLQTPATSISRTLQQLQHLGYIQRVVPYGENEKRSKKALYHLADPFLRLWFNVVAPHRGRLRTANSSARLKLLNACWPSLRAQAWEELCRMAVPRLGLFDRQWQSAGRYWQGNQSEWDVVSISLDNEITLLGECKSLAKPAVAADIDRIIRSVIAKSTPLNLGTRPRLEYVIFVPELKTKKIPLPPCITIVDGKQVFAALKDAIA